MNRAEVWWASSRQGNQRPYLILTRQIAIDHLHSVISVPTTRTIRGITTEVELDEDDGMPERCALTLDNLTLMPITAFEGRICSLSPARMAQVCTALRRAVDC